MIFIRHSPPAAEMKGICYGQTDIKVRDSHESASEVAIASLPDDYEPTIIYCSDLERCSGLAKSLGARFPGAELRVDPRLREMNFGRWENRPWSEIEATDGDNFTSWMNHWQTERAPDGESAADLLARVTAWWNEVDLARPSLVVGHAGSYRMLRRAIDSDLAWEEAVALPVPFLTGIEFSARNNL